MFQVNDMVKINTIDGPRIGTVARVWGKDDRNITVRVPRGNGKFGTWTRLAAHVTLIHSAAEERAALIAVAQDQMMGHE